MINVSFSCRIYYTDIVVRATHSLFSRSLLEMFSYDRSMDNWTLYLHKTDVVDKSIEQN